MSKNFKKEFYIKILKTSPNWTYVLRLRQHAHNPSGIQVAMFNPYTLLRHPELIDSIIESLNKGLEKEENNL